MFSVQDLTYGHYDKAIFIYAGLALLIFFAVIYFAVRSYVATTKSDLKNMKNTQIVNGVGIGSGIIGFIAVVIIAISLGVSDPHSNSAVNENREKFVASYDLVPYRMTQAELRWPNNAPERNEFFGTANVYTPDGALIKVKLVYQNEKFELLRVLQTGDLAPINPE